MSALPDGLPDGLPDSLPDDQQRSDLVDHAVRAGMVAYGVVHVMLGWLAVTLALGDRQGSTTSTGALQELAQQPFGRVLVWLVAVGMVLLVAWRLLEAAVGSPDEHEDGAERLRGRVSSLGKAVIYAVIGFSAFKVALGNGGSSGGSDPMTARLMNVTGGQFLVGLVGVAIVGYGLGQIWIGATDRFLKHLDGEGRTGSTGTAYRWFGKIGYAAKGVAFGVVGGLFVYAAVTHEAKESGGLDQALVTVLDQPFGPVLLVLIGVGIACYGLFCFARARHLDR